MLTPSSTLREVDGGKWRHEMNCGCAFLYERTPDNKLWTAYHVRACNGRFADGQHRRKQPEKRAALPKESAE